MFIPFDRAKGALEKYLNFVKRAHFAFDLAPEICQHEAKLVFCHYFLPPCGNSTLFEPPTSVCEDTCNYTRSLCPEEWELVRNFVNVQPSYLENGFTMINCSNTGEYLDPLSHCCLDLGICKWILLYCEITVFLCPKYHIREPIDSLCLEWCQNKR